MAVSADELEAALDALLGNVFAHTPEGTAFRVEVRTLSDGGISLAVEDAGPGLSPDFVERGVSGAGGTGLGLDIARRTAEGRRRRVPHRPLRRRRRPDRHGVPDHRPPAAPAALTPCEETAPCE